MIGSEWKLVIHQGIILITDYVIALLNKKCGAAKNIVSRFLFEWVCKGIKETENVV